MAEPVYVHTRANNIQCVYGDDPDYASMSCGLTRRSGPLAQPRPGDCDLTWGLNYYLEERGAAQMVCSNKWTSNWPGNLKFEPAEAQVGGNSTFGIDCQATRNTLKCTNRDGHGFYLSRRDQQLF